MIQFVSYKDCDIDNDPIIVLPCGHFYTITTLDGIFDMSQAYTRSETGYSGIATMTRNDNIKPKCCPECRAVVHSVARYGRLLSFLRLQFLERKHLMKIGDSLRDCAKGLESIADKSSAKTSINKKKYIITLEKRLLKILKDMKNGPTQKVFEACGGNEQVEIPSPPSNSVIQALQLLGQTYAYKIESVNDPNYQNAVRSFTEAIEICDDTSSYRLGGEARISLVKLQMTWNALNEESAHMLDDILTKTSYESFTEMHERAKRLKEEIRIGQDLRPVIEAMHVIEGYDYGGAWNSHWYECPNGHTYFIGNCGGAMVTATCFECGEKIGGNNHQLLQTNRQSDIVRKVLERS